MVSLPPSGITFQHYGRLLGLSDESIVEALCAALAIAGPAVPGGRYVGLGHPVEDDLPSHVALEQLRLAAEVASAAGSVRLNRSR